MSVDIYQYVKDATKMPGVRFVQYAVKNRRSSKKYLRDNEDLTIIIIIKMLLNI